MNYGGRKMKYQAAKFLQLRVLTRMNIDFQTFPKTILSIAFNYTCLSFMGKRARSTYKKFQH